MKNKYLIVAVAVLGLTTSFSSVAAGSTGLNKSASKKVASSNADASYGYTLTKNMYGNPVIIFSLNNVTESLKSVTVGSSIGIKPGGTPFCFGVDARYYSIESNNDPVNKINYTTFTAKTGYIFNPQISSTCGDFLYTDVDNYSFVMHSNLVQDIISPKVYSVSVIAESNTTATSLPEQPVSTTADPGNGRIIEGYFADWSIYNGMNFGPESIPYTKLNVIDYAFIYFDETTGNIYAGDYNSDGNAMPYIAQQIHQYPYIKGYLAFGGWTNYKNGTAQYAAPMFEQLASSQAKMDTFATQAVSAMRQLGFSGITLDWEWWSSTKPDQFNKDYAEKMLALYTTVRAALDKQGTIDGKKYYLSIAVSAGKDKIAAPETAYPGYWTKVYALVDHIGLMSYDMHGDWDVNLPSYFQAPWKMESGNPYQTTGYDIQTALATYQSYITPSISKFLIGVPAYGRASTIVSTDNAGLLQTITGTAVGQRTVEASMWDYKCIVKASDCTKSGQRSHSLTLVNQQNDYQGLWTKYSAVSSYEPWGFGTVDGQTAPVFMTYDDVYAVTQKVKQANKYGLSGMMLWEIDGDSADVNLSLFQAMVNEYAK